MTKDASFGDGDSWPVTTVVNGATTMIVPGDARRLMDVLRDVLGLTGVRSGCEVGVCGACTVLVDGRPTSSCLTRVEQVDGCDVLTVEGLERHPTLRALQDAFIAEGGYQCGFCTSGQLMTAASLVLAGELDGMTGAEVAEYMVGNLCRCGAYYGIFRAVDSMRGTAPGGDA